MFILDKCIFMMLKINKTTLAGFLLFLMPALAFCTNLSSFEKPFAANSFWNSRPVEAVLGDFQLPTSFYYPAVQEGSYSTGFFLAKYNDPAVKVTSVSGSKGVWDVDSEMYRNEIIVYHWPTNVVPASGTDGHADIVDPVTGIIHSFYQLKNTNGVWTAAQYNWTELSGRGWGDPAHYAQGARATGVPAVAGLIRKHEIYDGDSMYRHALTLSLPYNALSKAPSYIFPATMADTTAIYYNTGQIPEGALLMLPSTFNVDSLKTPELRKIANTLKTYGAYVTDRNFGTPFVIYVENGSDFNLHKNGWNSAAGFDLEKIRLALRQVISVKGWLDANDKPFKPNMNMNLISMRGPWQLLSDGEVGVFNSGQQAVEFRNTIAPVIQTNTAYRNISRITWAIPKKGKLYKLQSQASGGGQFRLQIFDNVLQQYTYDSGDLTNGQSLIFEWPSDDYQPSLTVTSGVGAYSKVRGTLVEVLR